MNKFDADTDRLYRFLFFAVAVAGKQAEMVRNKVDLLAGHLRTWYNQDNFTDNLRMALASNFGLLDRLKEVRFGQYNKMLKFAQVLMRVQPDLKNATVESLMRLPGIGPKTARFFILYTRPHERLAVLDTHILAWLREQKVEHVPKTTPQSARKYAKFERIFLEYCDKLGKTPQELDDEIWQSRTRSFKN